VRDKRSKGLLKDHSANTLTIAYEQAVAKNLKKMMTTDIENKFTNIS
jgi:hypothetical protein